METTNMTKTKALHIAQKAVCKPIRCSSSSYILYGPYYNDKPTGPTTEINCGSYQKAVQRRTEWVATIALSLLGADGSMVCGFVDRYGSMSARSIVRCVMAKAQLK
jgi:hypothetical protein